MKKIEIFWFVKLFLAQNFLSNKMVVYIFFKLKCVVMLTKISLKSFFIVILYLETKTIFFINFKTLTIYLKMFSIISEPIYGVHRS
jgi:hypothetical protein